jgi:hypothetical protein
MAIAAGASLLGGVISAARSRSSSGVAQPRDTAFTGTTTQTTTLTPEQETAAGAMAGGSMLRLGSAATALDAAGGWSSIVRPTPNPFALTPETEALRQSYLAQPSQAGARFAADPLTGALARATEGVWNTMASQPINVGGINYGAASVSYTPQVYEYEAVPVDTQAPVAVARIDPTAATLAARDVLEQVVTPGLTAAMTAGGLGRSGALGEAVSQRGLELALPITQQVLAHEAAAAQLEAQIRARQEEVQLLETQRARLQAQQLTAESRNLKESLQTQIATLEAQIRSRLAEAEFMGQVQAAIAQRQAALGFAANALGSWLSAGTHGMTLEEQRWANQLQAAQLPATLAQQDLLRQQQLVTSLLGMTPSGFPPLGHTTEQVETSLTDVAPFGDNPPQPPAPAAPPAPASAVDPNWRDPFDSPGL